MAYRFRKRRGCFLFYIYAFFLGLGTGLVATISLTYEKPPLLTWILIPLGLVVGMCTCVIHLVFTCRLSGQVQNARLKLIRSLIDIGGLTIATAITCTGTFTFTDAKGLFFLCGVFSAACYFVACIALTVNLVRTFAMKKTGRPSEAQEEGNNDWNNYRPAGHMMSYLRGDLDMFTCSGASPLPPFILPTYIDDSQVACDGDRDNRLSQTLDSSRSVAVISSGHLPLGGVIGYSLNDLDVLIDRQRSHDVAVNQQALHATPPSVCLPSYADVTTSSPHSPPKYSEISMTSYVAPLQHDGHVIDPTSFVVTSTEVVEGESGAMDAPPPYSE